MSDHITVYMTASSNEEAHRIARALIDARLAACVNILGAIESIFYWEGIQSETEVALIAKACHADFPAINETVRRVHSYDTPCVVAWPIVQADAAFAQWIHDETRGKRAME